MSMFREFSDSAAEPAVHGFLHEPAQFNGDALVLTHGAGANCQSKLLIAMADAFTDAGYLLLRCDLPFRQSRPYGPPFPATAARDRQGLRRAVEVLRSRTPGRIFLGGHSYGGRQGSMLAADQPQLVAGLLLLSYPLHPPRKPAELRTAHFPQLKTPSLFVHGGRDPFGSHDEIKAALALIPAQTMLLEIEGAGHELLGKKTVENLPSRIVQAFQEFFRKASRAVTMP
jgi:predicted alpha/beta-hydrolase family hydrolase